MKPNEEIFMPNIRWKGGLMRSLHQQRGKDFTRQVQMQLPTDDRVHHEKSSSDILKSYLSHLGIYHKKQRRRCISGELYRLATS